MSEPRGLYSYAGLLEKISHLKDYYCPDIVEFNGKEGRKAEETEEGSMWSENINWVGDKKIIVDEETEAEGGGETGVSVSVITEKK